MMWPLVLGCSSMTRRGVGQAEMVVGVGVSSVRWAGNDVVVGVWGVQ